MTSRTDFPSSSSSPPPPAFHKITYDVFLSFRGTDTRTNFTDHLYTALKQRGIFTFRDDEELERGESIAPCLFKAIEESRYVVVVFSRHYADSSWCLDEIAKITDCMKQMGLKVLPVFYDVDPYDVRWQTGEYFEKAFSKHQKRYEGEPNKVQRWKDALFQVSNISGWHLQNGSEAKVIQEVVHKIFTEIIQINSTSGGLVGMDSHMEKLFSILDLGHPDVHIIEICGMGGIGKTTIAQVVYEKIKDQFEGYCFLKNVREITEKKGLVHLQEKILSKLLNTNVNIEYIKMGKDIMMKTLSHKMVLIVLDDVNEKEQLDALCDRNWFGRGSRIIITSRDEHFISAVEGDSVYKVSPLNDAQAFQLFCMKAFKKDQLIGEDMVKLVKEFLSYADSLPLAIEVLGSSVKGRGIENWPSILDKLKQKPEKKLMKVLRVSFDTLEEREKQIFLDIACFLKGMERDRVRRILQGSYENCPDIDIEILLDRSMVTLLGKKLSMHDWMQELGWEVVREECRDEPGGRSRLWISNEIIHVLDRSKATGTVESISLQGPTEDNVVHSLNDSFSDMDNLRLLKIGNMKFSGNIKYLSNKLQYLEWHECPLDSFPADFQPENLVEVHILSSFIQQLWQGEQGWSMLRLIDLSGSKYLRSTPDFTKVPHLEILDLEDCTSLIEVHPSLGYLKKLMSLNMRNCKSVESIPPLANLENLKLLNISLCSRLKKFPEIIGNMENLLELFLDGSSIEELPKAVACLSDLTFLNLSNCKNLLRLPSVIRCLTSMKRLLLEGCLKINDIPDGMDFLETLHIGGTAVTDLSFTVGMKNLKHLACQGCKGLASESGKALHPLWSLTGLIELDLSDCGLTDGAIPDDLSSLKSLTTFDLRVNGFVRLPESISQLSKLDTLLLCKCRQLQWVPKLPSRVRFVYAIDCNSLMDFPNQIKILTSSEGVTVINSLNEAGKTLIDRVWSSSLRGQSMHFLGKTKKRNTEWKQQFNVSFEQQLKLLPWKQSSASVIPGDEIPEWFSTKYEGNPISILIPPNLRHDDKWHGIAVCAVFSQNRRNTSAISLVNPGSDIYKHLFQCTLTTDLICMKPAFIDMEEEQLSLFRSISHLLAIFYIPKWQFPKLLDQSTMMWARFEACNPSSWEIQICGIRLVYEQDAQWRANIFPFIKYIKLNEGEGAMRNSGWLSCVGTFWKWEPCTPPGKQDSTTILQRKNLESVLPRYFEANKHAVLFKFNLSGFPGWCMYTFNNDGLLRSPVSIRLPSNFHKRKKWMGIVVYASIAEKEPHTSEKDYHVYVNLHIGEKHIFRFFKTVRSSEEPHQLLFVYIPRSEIIQEFTQTSGTILTMAFSTDSPGGEVQRRGYDIVDKPEGLEEFVKTIILCMQRSDSLKLHEKWVVENWLEILRLKGDLCTPNKHYSRTRRERKFELISRTYRKWDWFASGFFCYFFGAADICIRKKRLMYFTEGNSVEIKLPPNLLGDPNWLGIAVCAIHWRSHEDQDIILDTPGSDRNVFSWTIEFNAALDRLCTFRIDQPLLKLRPQDVLADWTYYMYVPRTRLNLRRQWSLAKANFWSCSPCLGVRRCALRLVYKDDIEDLVQSLTLCELP